jgi:glycosyltransferase involved in cell wall biosynthesis
VKILSQEFPSVGYIVVGDGKGLDACKTLASELGIADRVQFVGYRRDIETYLAQMDLFIFPSLKEGMGLALVEAMALGLATVATNVGGIPEVIKPECGILVPPQSPDDLAKNAGDLLRDHDRRAKMEAAATERARTVFSVDSMQSGTLKIYRGLL